MVGAIRSTVMKHMTTPHGLFIMMCITVILTVLGTVQYLNIDNTPALVGSHESDVVDLEGIPPIATVNRNDVLRVLEQSNVEKYGNGLISMYPVTGSSLGGDTITFIFAIQNDSVANIWPSKEYFGGCIIDGTWAPVSKSTLWDSSKVFLLSCVLPPHPPGEVEVAFIVDNVTRYVDNGAARFTYSHPDKTDEPITPLALCTVFKDQALYLREWIAFHSIFGVTKFYLYDQGSTDNWEESIKDFISSGVVVPVHWSFSLLTPSIRHQSIAFWHSINTFGKHTKWMGFIDIDEFLFIPKSAGSPNPSIVKLLESFEDFGGLMVDRINFGPNGHVQRPPGLVIENYTKRVSNARIDQAVKSIVQPKHVAWAGCGGVHTFTLNKGIENVDATKRTREDGCGIPFSNVVWDPIRINHYFTKSVEDWAERVKRFGSNIYPVPPSELLERWSYFNVDDTDILEYLEDTEKRMVLL